MPRLDQLPPTEELRSRKTFCRVLQGIVTLGYHVDPRRLGSVLAKALVMVVGAIARLEAPASSWPMWSAGQYLPGAGEEREQPLAKCLPGFLQHRSAEVRLTAATQLTYLKPGNGLVWLESSLRPCLRKSFALPTSLALLASLSLEHPSLTTPLLIVMFDVARQAQDSTLLLEKAIALVARNCGSDPESLLLSRLSCLLASHLDSGQGIHQFPCSHFCFEQSKIQDFLKAQEKSVVPVTLQHEPTKERLNSLATFLNRTPAELLKVNMSGLALHFIPGVVASDFGIELPNLENMKALANLVEDQLGNVAFQTAVEKQYVATLENAFSTAYDPNHLSETFGFDHVPETAKPCVTPALNASIPKALIQFCHNHFLGEGQRSLWSQCANDVPDKFVKMLSSVSSAFNDQGLSTPARLRAIHCLWLFLDELGDHLGEPELQPLLPALVLLPCSSLLHLLHSTMDQSLLRAGLGTLHKLLSIVTLTPEAATLLYPVIFSVNYCLTALISRNDNLLDEALVILNLLFVRNGFRFPKIMEQLEDFPSTEAFSHLQTAIDRVRKGPVELTKAIKRFLEVAATTEVVFLLLPLRAMLTRLKTELAGQTLDSKLIRRLFSTLMQVLKLTIFLNTKY